MWTRPWLWTVQLSREWCVVDRSVCRALDRAQRGHQHVAVLWRPPLLQLRGRQPEHCDDGVAAVRTGHGCARHFPPSNAHRRTRWSSRHPAYGIVDALTRTACERAVAPQRVFMTTPRFSSEYGFQSMPSFFSIEKISLPEVRAEHALGTAACVVAHLLTGRVEPLACGHGAGHRTGCGTRTFSSFATTAPATASPRLQTKCAYAHTDRVEDTRPAVRLHLTVLPRRRGS